MDHVRDAVAEFMPPVRSAERVGAQVGAHREIAEADAFMMQAVEVRGFEHRIAVAGEIAVALIIL